MTGKENFLLVQYNFQQQCGKCASFEAYWYIPPPPEIALFTSSSPLPRCRSCSHATRVRLVSSRRRIVLMVYDEVALHVGNMRVVRQRDDTFSCEERDAGFDEGDEHVYWRVCIGRVMQSSRAGHPVLVRFHREQAETQKRRNT